MPLWLKLLRSLDSSPAAMRPRDAGFFPRRSSFIQSFLSAGTLFCREIYWIFSNQIVVERLKLMGENGFQYSNTQIQVRQSLTGLELEQAGSISLSSRAGPNQYIWRVATHDSNWPIVTQSITLIRFNFWIKSLINLIQFCEYHAT